MTLDQFAQDLLRTPGMPTVLGGFLLLLPALACISWAARTRRLANDSNSLGKSLEDVWSARGIRWEIREKYKGAGAYHLGEKVAILPGVAALTSGIIMLAMLGHEIRHGLQHRSMGRMMRLLDRNPAVLLLGLVTLSICGGALPFLAQIMFAYMAIYLTCNLVIEADANYFSVRELALVGFTPQEVRAAGAYLTVAWGSYLFSFAGIAYVGWGAMHGEFYELGVQFFQALRTL